MDTQKVTDFVAREFTADMGIDAQLDRVVELRQSLISSKLLPDLLEFLGKSHGSYKQNERYRFLEAVIGYDAAVNRKEADPDEWMRIVGQFEQLPVQSANPQVRAYRLVYMWLGKRNAGSSGTVLAELFLELLSAAAYLTELKQRHECLGHSLYNNARQLLKAERHYALKPWQLASEHRIAFFECLVKVNASREEMLAAAQQIVKMRYDFQNEKFFPEVDIDLCGVPKELYDDFIATFGEEDATAFCVTKPKKT